MWAKNVATLLALALVAFAAADCAGDEQANEDNTEGQATTDGLDGEKDLGQSATLELQGEPGTEFQGSCAVGDDEPEDISGQLPESFTYNLEGRRLDCEIISASDVQVTLTVGKNVRSAQQISGGTLNLTYQGGSISSNVSSLSGSSGQDSSSSIQEPSGMTNEPGNVTSESRDVSGFNEVELKGIGNLSIEQTGSESLIVEAEEEVLPKIRTEVDNNRLIIGPKPNTSLSTTESINYKLTVKDLNALKVSGSGDVEAEGIDTDELAVGISGSGDVKIGGKAGSQDIEISGSGSYRAEDLESAEAKIEVGGSGSAIVNVSEELEAEVSGSGSVDYVGNPTVNQDVRGTGEVRKH